MIRFPEGHMVKVIHNNGQPVTRFRITSNSTCPCGSGKKYKKCCKERQIVNSKTGQYFIIKNGD